MGQKTKQKQKQTALQYTNQKVIIHKRFNFFFFFFFEAFDFGISSDLIIILPKTV